MTAQWDMTYFCSFCQARSVTVHSAWEAEERYGWLIEGHSAVCPACQYKTKPSKDMEILRLSESLDVHKKMLAESKRAQSNLIAINQKLLIALKRAHSCATVQADGTCDGCFVSEAIKEAEQYKSSPVLSITINERDFLAAWLLANSIHEMKRTDIRGISNSGWEFLNVVATNLRKLDR